jgi:hypothetical protein
MSRTSLSDQLGIPSHYGVTIDMLEASIEETRESVVEEPQILQAAFDIQQVRDACKLDLDFLAATVSPDTFILEFPAMHKTAWQILIDGEADAEHKFLQFAIGIPRGHAKTTLIKLFIIWCILYSKRKFILVACAIEQHACNILADVTGMLQHPNVLTVFGDYRLGVETDTIRLKKFGFQGRNIILAAVGAEGSVRGFNLNNDRPDLMIFDDIQSKECADSETQSKILNEWMVGTAMKAKSPFGCMFIFAGNMFATSHSILRKLKANPRWIKFVCGAILADGTALWPELKSYEDLIEELDNDIAMGMAHIFFAEVLNDTEAGVNSNVDYSKFPVWPWNNGELPQGKFLLIDPSQGKGKDADVILTCEVYDEKIGIKHVHEEHYSPANLIRRALITAIQTDTYCIAIESMAYQSTLLYWFQFICDQLKISGISFVPIYTNSHSKNSRILSGIKAMQTSEIFLHPDVRSQVQNQIKDWNPLKRDNKDDILDAISNAPKVVADYAGDILCHSTLLVLEAETATVQEDNHAF